LLPRGPYLTTGGQRYVYVIEGDQAIKTAVTFGELQTEQVQILQGLSVGDEVIISGYQNFIEHNTIMLQGADK
jgi:HlyD family secretion protein